MISAESLRQAAALDGKITCNEGRRLAELASQVPAGQVIVEVGSFKGQSACYLGLGSRAANYVPIFAVDLWELHRWSEYSNSDVFRTWQSQVAELGLSELVTPIRCDSETLGRLFSAPIGLLFIDGSHAHDAVARDFHAWSSHVVDGGVIAFHDFDQPSVGDGVRRVVEQYVVPAQDWSDIDVVDSMAVVTRTGAESSREASWEFVSNAELSDRIRRRPAQYGLDLATIVRHRDEFGIYVDTHCLEYDRLCAKYQDDGLSLPLVERIDSHCRTCQRGATCNFVRLPAKQRAAIVHSKDRERWEGQCQTDDWGSVTDVVYPYVAAPASGDELRYSIRSVYQNYVGTPRIWVVGDKPAWYCGNHIPHQRLSNRAHLPRFDRAAKLQKVVRTKQIDREFIWMMDDVYFVQPLTLMDCRRRWRRGNMNAEKLPSYEPNSPWQEEKLLTWQALASAGRPIDDVTCHRPIAYEKDKLRSLFSKYDLLKRPYVDDLLYHNEFATHAATHFSEILYEESGNSTVQQIRQRAAGALVMNHVESGYTDAMQTVLKSMFPDPSPCECP